MTALGKVVSETPRQFMAESIVYNAKGEEIGRGNGIFFRSKNKLMDIEGYRSRD